MQSFWIRLATFSFFDDEPPLDEFAVELNLELRDKHRFLIARDKLVARFKRDLGFEEMPLKNSPTTFIDRSPNWFSMESYEREHSAMTTQPISNHGEKNSMMESLFWIFVLFGPSTIEAFYDPGLGFNRDPEKTRLPRLYAN